ncbi:MAG: von Willebrand factor type A domain-containing protein [Dehalococcoidia bacterium]
MRHPGIALVLALALLLGLSACGGRAPSSEEQARRTLEEWSAGVEPVQADGTQTWALTSAAPAAGLAFAESGRIAGEPPRQRPPNGEPYHDTFFENYGVNPFIATEDEQVSTFAMDVDTASYTVARAYIQEGSMPPKDAIRVEEFINYFAQSYPDSDGAFALHLDGAHSAFGEENKHLLRVGIQSKHIGPEERRDAVLTFVIDVSGSMGLDNRLGLVKRSLQMLTGQLRDEDEVGIVVYGSHARLVLEPTSDKDAILSAIDGLTSAGSTNAEHGLLLGYETAAEAFQEGKINRVILASDGVANVGETGADAILENVKGLAEAGITLTTLGVGMANYNDVLMEKLANHGDGSYFYLDTDDEAAQLFGPGLPGMLEIIASDAKVQVEFNPETVDRYRLIGYENRALETEDFEDDSVDAGEVGAGHSVTALYELRLRDGASGKVADVRVRHLDPRTGEPSETGAVITAEAMRMSFAQAAPRFRFTAAVAEFAEILRESFWAEEGTLDAVYEHATDALAAFETFDATERDWDFIAMVENAMALDR